MLCVQSGGRHMQRSGGPDIKVRYFDVPPLDLSADLRRSEPMRAVLEPEPGSNWVDLFYEFIHTSNALLIRAHPVIDDGAIVFSPDVDAARGTCILLKKLVAEVNARYRTRGFASPDDLQSREGHREKLAALAEALNRGED